MELILIGLIAAALYYLSATTLLIIGVTVFVLAMLANNHLAQTKFQKEATVALAGAGLTGFLLLSGAKLLLSWLGLGV